jgi:hypothetical protein
VFFEFPCQFIKLVFARNYPNDFNVFNQIGVASIKVFPHPDNAPLLPSLDDPPAMTNAHLAEIQRLEQEMRQAASE